MDPVSFSIALDGCAAALALTLACFQGASATYERLTWAFCGMCASVVVHSVCDALVRVAAASFAPAMEASAVEYLALFGFCASYAGFLVISRASFGLVPASIVFPSVAVLAELLVPRVSMLGIVSACGLLWTLVSAMPLRERAIERRQAELIRARADAVLSQIQPHFLYNTLTAIRRLCRVDTERAGLMLDDFSAYLRGNMESLTRREAIPFAEELAHTQKYLELEQLRLGERLAVSFDIRVVDFDMPALTLQTLVENAVRHGIAKRPEGGSLQVSTYRVGRTCCVSVVDDGVGFDGEAAPPDDGRLHVGLESTRLRLKNMCDGSLEIESAPGRGTSALVSVPGRA